jgi:hypothetical protein
MQRSLTAAAPAPSARHAKPALRTRITWWFLVVVLGVHAALAVGQPVFAGALLSGNADAIGFHEAGGEMMHLACFVQLPATVLFWRPGRGPLWPALLTVLLAVAEGAQIGLGEAHQLGIHIPLGVLIVGWVVALFVWSITWRVRQGRRFRLAETAR